MPLHPAAHLAGAHSRRDRRAVGGAGADAGRRGSHAAQRGVGGGAALARQAGWADAVADTGAPSRGRPGWVCGGHDLCAQQPGLHTRCPGECQHGELVGGAARAAASVRGRCRLNGAGLAGAVAAAAWRQPRSSAQWRGQQQAAACGGRWRSGDERPCGEQARAQVRAAGIACPCAQACCGHVPISQFYPPPPTPA